MTLSDTRNDSRAALPKQSCALDYKGRSISQGSRCSACHAQQLPNELEHHDLLRNYWLFRLLLSRSV